MPAQIVKPPVSRGAIVKENLPFPIVYYPNHYGTFMAFAKDEHSDLFFCACSELAMINYLKLKAKTKPSAYATPLRRALLDNFFFPNLVAELSIKYAGKPRELFKFEKGLCHRCNLAVPTLRYCHQNYGGEFMQHYGWYINQTYFRFGIHPIEYCYLKDVCPPEFQQDITKFLEAKAAYQAEYQRIMKIVQGPKRRDIASNERTYWHNVRYEEAAEMIRLRKIAGQLKRNLTIKIENITREEFGFKKLAQR